MNSDDTGADGSSRWAWHSGSWRPSDQLSLSIQDAAVTQSATAVERIRAYGATLFQRDRHLQRWQRTITALNIQGLPSKDRLCELLDELIRRNRGWVDQNPSFGALLLASPGITGGDQPTLIADLYPINAAAMRDRMEHGSPVVVTSVQQPSPQCWPRDIKVRCRLHYYLADSAAAAAVPGALGILVDQDGSVTETGICNVLVVDRGALISPPADQILPGVSLQVVRELAAQLDVPFRESRITPDQLKQAAEVLLTGTSCGVWFANSVDAGPTRTAGPIYRRLRTAFDQLIGRRPD
ncbi:branched-chain amino acid aminotransferase [Roseiconus nitratireducens]|uniref:Branched-chain amino acid aminotransferase n=1 Tax=Roseiconus nitratireducens TaxID=2605748 RepID=A0A5M6D045_9BACT|nr:aminotransferase class IV [Roseiconus nitratireducens]KAA5540713.1 branched-chain amino acid aminotransferase [Roseiconus nitratireducens]